ncbi:MAG: ATP-dependent DNA helicase RecG [Lachnospiraceae bacterium]|nr:ATP-dependent DNA helicase RecG [Lachnospiraceae bacterium]
MKSALSDISIESIKGIGEKTAASCHKLDLYTVFDLVEYYPRRYEIYPHPTPVAELAVDKKQAVCVAIIGKPTDFRAKGMQITSFQAGDETGRMKVTYFRTPYVKKQLMAGRRYILYGKVKQGRVMEQPLIFSQDEYDQLQKGMWPIYSLTQGISNKFLRKTIKTVLTGYRDTLEEVVDYTSTLSVKEREHYHLMPLSEALYQIHFPDSDEMYQQARRRIVFNEFYEFLNGVLELKDSNTRYINHFPMIETADTVRFLEALPYKLTNGQKKAWAEIREDLEGKYVMNRLIQGDVGCGKTILAFLSMIMSAANGYQSAMMAPTEVLARQHFEDLIRMKEQYHLAIHPVLLTSSVKGKIRKEIYADIASGEANVIIGTQALIQESVAYHKLGLVITDEQHRFGVRQRDTLAGKSQEQPHIMVMSATPIPRTLAMILYADLNISAIHELPGGRKPIKNAVVGPGYSDTALRFMVKEIQAGHQVYVICPMIEGDDEDDSGLKNVKDHARELKNLLPETIRIGTLTGKMKPAEKTRVMEAFAAKDIDLLVSTTVIEVGINVPNATVMVIRNAEHFGLAQLHQLRGRVGRGDDQSYCIFMASDEEAAAGERLGVLKNSNDGFHIAEEDLRLRGPGELFGERQSGDLAFRLGDIITDSQVLLDARDCINRNGQWTFDPIV